MNLSYELIEYVKRNSCLCHFNSQRYFWYNLYQCWLQSWHILLVNKCEVTEVLLSHGAAEVSFQPAQPTKWSFCRKWYIILESYAKISSRLEVPDTNYIEQYNIVPNNNTIANMYLYITIWSPLKIKGNSSRARQPLSCVNFKKNTHTYMQTSLKFGFAQISLAAQKTKLPEFWGCPTPAHMSRCI